MTENIVLLKDRSQDEWAGLIRKLRWIGLDAKARRLEQAVRALPREDGSLSAVQLRTD